VRERAAQQGAGDLISPSKGLYISKIRRIAQESDSAETNKLATTVALRSGEETEADENNREPQNQHGEESQRNRGQA